MQDNLPPTLEDLRDVPEPAWLWDGARARLVWANAAGIAWFGGQTLFDLVDRPFDLQEGGVARIASLSRSLRRGQVENCLLHFPSVTPAPVACRCMTHALPDGRPGILAVAAATPARDKAAQQADAAAAFDLLPSPAVLVSEDGDIRHLNAAALLLLGGGQRASLAAVLGDQAQVDELLSRTAGAGLVTLVKALPVRFGTREIRMTSRRLAGEEGGAFALVLLDDITERRALERGLTAKPVPTMPAAPSPAPPPQAVSDAEAFARLAEVLRRETGTIAPAPAKPAAPEAPAPRRTTEPVRHAAELPRSVRQAIDNIQEALMIARDGQLLYANAAACKLFGYENADAVLSDSVLWERFSQLGQSLPATQIDLADGRSVTATVQLSIIPWLSGPARQFVLRKVASSNPDIIPLKPVAAVLRQAETPSELASQAQPAAAVPVPATEPPPPAASSLPAASPAAADAELRAILDTVADGIITLDAKGLIHSFSAGAEAIFGYRIAEVVGKPFVDLIAADSRKAVRDYLAALQGPGLASVFNDGREVNAVVKQGGAVPLFLTLGRLQAPNSNAAFCAVVRDITQWKKAESELREAKELAEATSRQKSEFLARISHELRTPLNAIMGFSEVMRLQRFGKIENDKYLGYANDIHASGSHLLSLINDLLDLSKVEAGKLELNFTSVGLSDVADHVIRMLQEEATAARVVLRKAMPADLPHVVADLRSMRQILLNLVSNALKFTDPGGQVIISAHLNPAGELKLRVKDTGIGMNEEQIRDALEPFRRVTTEGRDAPGTGLGLPLTKALAEANRTQFAISSEPRKGTLVEITFPTTRVLAG